MLISVLCLWTCSSSSPKTDVSLIDNTQWTLISFADEDPFLSTRVASSLCEEGSYGSEPAGNETWFSIKTDDCNYITISQPLLVDVHAGETLMINVFHFYLNAPEYTEAHLALSFGSDVAWQTAVPIPSESGSVFETFQAADDYAAGSPIIFHLDNHGANSYHLISVTVNQ